MSIGLGIFCGFYGKFNAQLRLNNQRLSLIYWCWRVEIKEEGINISKLINEQIF